MSTIKDIIDSRKHNDDKQEPKHIISHGTTIGVDTIDSPQVLSRPGFVWVRENDQAGGVFQVFNPSVKLSLGLPVIISRESGASSRRTIKGIDWSALANYTSTGSTALSLPNHHRDHEWPIMLPGMDPINIYSRAMTMLKIYPGASAITLSVAPGYYMLDDATIYFSGLVDDDISSHVPSTVGNSVSVLVYIDVGTNLVAYLDGTESALLFPVEPTVPDGVIPLGYIRLAHGVSGLLTESNITNDPRPFISIATGSGSGTVLGSGAANLVAVFTDANTVYGDVKFWWDVAHDVLYIGSAIPDTVPGLVNISQDAASVILKISSHGAGSISVMSLRSTSGTHVAPVHAVSTQELGRYCWSGYGDTDWNLAGFIRVIATGTFTDSDAPSKMILSVGKPGDWYAEDVLQIDHDGIKNLLNDRLQLKDFEIDLTSPTDTYVITYDLASNKWIPAPGGGGGAIPVKASGAELDTGTDDAKFATAKALKDSHNVPSVIPSTPGNVLMSDGTYWVSAGPAGSSPLVVTKSSRQTRTVLYDVTLGSAGTWDVSGIDQSYDHLEIIGDFRADAAAAYRQVRIIFNNDTGSNYQTLTNWLDEVAYSTGNYSSYFRLDSPADSADSGMFGQVFCTIYDYTKTDRYKSLLGKSLIYETATVLGQEVNGGWWKNTDAINRITISPESGNYIAGSRLQIIGIKAENIVTDVAGSSYLPNGTAQYQIPVTGATPFAPVYSGYLLDGTTGGKTSLAVTSGKTLTLTTVDNFNLTVSGTASVIGTNTGDNSANSTYAIGSNTQAWNAKLDAYSALAAAAGVLHNDGAGAVSWVTASTGDISGTGVAGQIAEFVTNTKTLQAAKLIGPATNILTLTNSAAATLALAITAGKTLTLTAVDDFNLIVPATGTAALLNQANSFTLINPLTTIAESWIGPSSTAGIYFKGGNRGIGTVTPLVKLQITQVSDGNYPTLGTTKGLLFLSASTNLYGLFAGINENDGSAWMQVMRNDAATAYDLILQPVGGRVAIGGTAAPNLQLVVTGNQSNDGIEIIHTSSTGIGMLRLKNDAGKAGQFSVYGSNFGTTELQNNAGFGAENSIFIYSDSQVSSGGSNSIYFMAGGNDLSTTIRMTINPTGIGIGTTLKDTSHITYGKLNIQTGGLLFTGQSASAYERPLASIVPAFVVNTDASRTTRFILNTFDAAGTREVMRGEASGSVPMVGFLGAGAVVRPAKASHNNWANISDVVQALVDLGLADAV
jgi:hypothetical protein